MLSQISKHVASLTEGEIVEESDLGSIRRVTADNLAILNGLSIKRLLINPGAMRTPHWHANANELTYCVSGTALVSVLDTGSQFSSFVVRTGDMFHIDSGSLHHIENIGNDTAEFIITFRHERPEDFGLGAAFGAMTDAVLGNTYDLPASDFAAIRGSTTDRPLAARDGDPDVPATAYFDDPHKFSVEAMTPPVSMAVGNNRTARLQYWPALKDLSMYSLRIREDGMREPHWHPITAELGYVDRGAARMTVMIPAASLTPGTCGRVTCTSSPAPTPTTSRSSTPRRCTSASSSISPPPVTSAIGHQPALTPAKCSRQRLTPTSTTCPTSRSPKPTR
jgi:oxalate decarboxylase